eukprot:CAMPEP_0184699808 /NCGR_PEP_ID=MMETSP0313-20130426/5930_1 /TAXON_ID=2792 /ORGANISM="Porphyridium aerugineum, Strain SAG 1380-2" /LENGTH=708 /DNA_ID=CAMNT_0027158935 /DNA_START=378 /DNA_END=2504 /DNA_ORIENTATION=+
MAPSVPDYSRKHKSLGLLCQNFLATYGTKNDEDICLDMAAERLNVERRRIYDIVNVLESVGIVLRRAKNTYVWMGQEQLELTLKYLHKEAMELQQAKSSNDKTPNQPPTTAAATTTNNNNNSNCNSHAGAGAESGDAGPSSFKTPNKTNAQASSSKDTPSNNNLSGNYQVVKDTGILAVRPADMSGPTGTAVAGTSASPIFETITPAAASASASKSESSRKEKALGVLSQRFVCLFLVDPDRTLSLEEAAAALIDPNQPPAASPSPGIKIKSNSMNADDPDDDEGNGESSVQMKTRVRRLYDIANILASLGLIDKKESFRRPSFTWRGPRYDTNAAIQSSPTNPTRFILRVGDVPASPAAGSSKPVDKSSSKKRKTPSRSKTKESPGKIDEDGIDLNSKLDDEDDRNDEEEEEDEDEDGVKRKKRRDDLMPWEKASSTSKPRRKGKADPKGKESSSKEDKAKPDATASNLMNVFSNPDMFQAGYQQIMAPFMASMMMGNNNPAAVASTNTSKKGGTPAGSHPGMPASNQSMLLQQQMAMLSAMMQNGLSVPVVPKSEAPSAPSAPSAPEESVAPSSRSSKIAPPLPAPSKPSLLPQMNPADTAIGAGGGHTLLTNEEVDEYMRNAQRAGPQFYQQAKVWHAQYQAWLTQRQAVLGYMQLLQQQPGGSAGGASSTQQAQQQPNSAQLLQQQMLAAAYAGMAGQNGFLPK